MSEGLREGITIKATTTAMELGHPQTRLTAYAWPIQSMYCSWMISNCAAELTSIARSFRYNFLSIHKTQFLQ